MFLGLSQSDRRRETDAAGLATLIPTTALAEDTQFESRVADNGGSSNVFQR